MTLLCTHHHRALHEGGFGIVREADETLRFVTADGRTIPQHGYRLEDVVDGGEADGVDSAPRECSATQPRALPTQSAILPRMKCAT